MFKSVGIALNFESSDEMSKASAQIYHQTLQSIKASPAHDFSRLCRIFSAFTKKALSSLCLKQMCFQHGEIFVICKETLYHLLHSTENNPRYGRMNLSRSLLLDDDFDDPLLAAVLERLKLYHQVLSTLVAVFHGSSVLYERDNSISEMSGPFHISSWLDVLTADVYEGTSQSVGLEVRRDYETIACEVDQSISMASRGLSSPSSNGFKSSLTWNMSQSVVNSDVFMELGETDSYTERVLTPLKNRAEHSTLEFSQAFNSSGYTDSCGGMVSSLSSSVNRGK